MNKSQLLERFFRLCQGHEIEVFATSDPASASFTVEHHGVTVRGTVVCEEGPAEVQIVRRLPFKTLPRHAAGMVQLLNRLNLRTRFRSYQFDPEDREVVFRLGHAVQTESAVSEQLAFAFGMAVATFAPAARHLASFASTGGRVDRVLRASVQPRSCPPGKPSSAHLGLHNRHAGPERPTGLN